MKRVGRQMAKGFSVIELLVVIAIIAILAAIVTVGYTNIQRKAYDSTVQADLMDNMKILNQYYADKSTYPAVSQLGSLDPKMSFLAANYAVSGNAALYCRSADGAEVSLIAKSKSGKAFLVGSDNKQVREASFTFPGGYATVCPLSNPKLGTGSIGSWPHTSAGGWAAYVNAG